MSTFASDTHFQDHLPTYVSELQDKPVGSTVAGGSVEDSLDSSGTAPPLVFQDCTLASRVYL